MTRAVFLTTVAFVVLTKIADCILPGDYQSLPAQVKQDILWSEINQDVYDVHNLPHEPLSPASMAGLMDPSYLTNAFTHVSDEMLNGRRKLIHTYGAAAKVSFNIHPGSRYTGIFRQGHYPAIIRASIGLVDPTNFNPSLAIKVLVSGRPSANMFAMYHPDGQGDNFNYFAHPFVTTIPAPKSPATQGLFSIFASGLQILPGGPSERPESEINSPVYEHAQINENQAEVYAPYMVVLIPNPAVGWNPNNRTDYRAKLAELPIGVRLWEVAVRRTESAENEVIGEIVTESRFVSSPYEDQQLYFQHPSRRWRS